MRQSRRHNRRSLMKFFEGVTLIVGGALVLWLGYGLLFESNIEAPTYTKLPSVGGVSLRSYPKILVVSHAMGTQNQSFRQLFRYIDGNNAAKQKIPMTAPVIQSNGQMMFVMPNAMAEAPDPTNSNLSVKSLNNLKVAVQSFRGSARGMASAKKKLEKNIKAAGLTPTGVWYLSQYNSPWVFPLLRKNEVWIEVN